MRKPSSSFLTKVVYFFPLQLLFVHLKKNQQLLLFWLILFLIIFQEFGLKYGIPYLFLAPEYLGELSFSSYFIVGFSIGGFVTAFNISSYVMNAFRFPFLATLSKPFFKYALNNSFIPATFVSCYCYLTFSFLTVNENFSLEEALYRILGFILGYIAFTVSSTLYFLATNKDFEKLFGKELAHLLSSGGSSKDGEPGKLLLKKKNKLWYNNEESKLWRVESYLNSRLKLKATRPFEHYDKKMLSQVFRQNHINASFFQISILLSIIILGVFRETDYFIIPAGASIVLLFTILIMLTSAIRSWTKGWTLMVIVGLLILVNYLTKHDSFYYESKAFGMSYDTEVDYLHHSSKYPKEKINADLQMTINRLEKWKKNTGEKLPKAVFLATSGGGSRAAFWSFLSLQHLDSITDSKLTKNLVMGTGSSGGMIGTSYFRELKWRQQQQELEQEINFYKKDMAKDILNPVVFSLTVNDILLRTQRFESAGSLHWKDRGYIFERTLHHNTHQLLNKKLADYKLPEQEAKIPSLIFTPSIIDDNKRLIVSTLPLSFLCQSTNENIDYQSVFKDNQPNNIHFSTLLRMNASFPYIMPTISLPTKPKIEVFDSGLKDNYGIKTTLNYIYHVKDWLEKNTSGIVILQIRDGLSQVSTMKTNRSQSIINEILTPFGSLYGNWFGTQDFNNKELLSYLNSWYSGDVNIINYELNKSKENYISLSWHLTSKEKTQIINSISLANNRKAEQQLLQLLNSNP